jgi:glycine/D-amino acid oxidase-like deaminating enzyme
MQRLINRVIAAPGIHLHQRDDGRIVMGEQSGAPQNDAHAARLGARPIDFPDQTIAQQHGNRIMTAAKQLVPQITGAEFEATYIGWRPLPLDGHPVLGISPSNSDVYLAIMHSGVTLAPIAGQLAAHELIENVEVERLEPYRPTRIFKNITRY